MTRASRAVPRFNSRRPPPAPIAHRPSPTARTCEQTSQQRENHDRVRRVEEKAREMVAAGVHPPDIVVEAERHPRERDVVAHVERRPHPPELLYAEPAKMRVVDEVLVVVPVDESVSKDGQERRDRCRRDDGGNEPPVSA